MKLQRLLGKAVCVVSAAALFLMPLAACDNDNGDPELRGMQVTEEELRERVDDMRNSSGFTMQIDREEEYIWEEGRRFSTEIYKCDLNKTAFYYTYSAHIICGDKIERKAYDGYYFKLEKQHFYVHRKSLDSHDWEVDYTEADHEILYEQFFRIPSYIIELDLSTYDENDMAYTSSNDRISDEISQLDKYRLYILEESIVWKATVIEKDKEQKIRREFIYTQTHKDIGTTSFEVPDEVYAAIEEYKANGSNR